MISVATKRAAV